MFLRLAGVGFTLLGMAYLIIPRKIYHFGPEFLRDTQSESSDPDNLTVWIFRFIGVCLVVMGISYIF